MATEKLSKPVIITKPMSIFLDAVRFAAACSVLLHHAAMAKFGTYLPWKFTQTGIEPVILFFVLSGFVIAYTAETHDRSLAEYGLSRAARLLSVTIPAVALTALLDRIGSAIAPTLYADHWSDAATLANIETPLVVQVGLTTTFLNEVWFWNVWPGTNSPFWSLGYEAAYYVLFGIAFYERRQLRRVVWLLFFSMMIGPKILMLLPVWLLGVAAWQLYKRVTIGPMGGAVLCIVAVLTYVAFIFSHARNVLNHETERFLAYFPSSLIGMSEYFLSALVSGLLFALIILGFKGFEHKLAVKGVPARLASLIRLLAACTFSMYLYHYPLIYFFRALASLAPSQGELTARSWWITILVLVGTGCSVYALAALTERRKAGARRLITTAVETMGLGAVRRFT